MRIKDGLKLKGFPAEIPDASRDDLPGFFKELGYKVGVEVGTYKGEFAKKLCQAGLKLYAVDPYAVTNKYHQGRDKYQYQQDKVFEEAKKNLKGLDCTFVRKFSMDAYKDFEDESLDFVYIDGDHSFRYIAEDLHEWSKKVRKGGIISGHDYYNSKAIRHWNIVHVKAVVDAFAIAMRLKNFYVLGERYSPTRDKWRSFFWIKE